MDAFVNIGNSVVVARAMAKKKTMMMMETKRMSILRSAVRLKGNSQKLRLVSFDLASSQSKCVIFEKKNTKIESSIESPKVPKSTLASNGTMNGAIDKCSSTVNQV